MREIRTFMAFRNISRIHYFIYYFIKCFFIFKNPLKFIYCYIKRQQPPDNIIELRNGNKIFLSSHAHDIVTVFIIFAKNIYGSVAKDSIVLDIGANIGVFSLFAAISGAKKVFAYEPNPEAYRVLQKNITQNNFDNIIKCFNLAVSDKENIELKFPINSSPYSKNLNADQLHDYQMITTTTLQNILIDNNLDFIDFLKIDCEGCEFEVLYNLPPGISERIKNIRMEFHGHYGDNVIDLIEYLAKYNFQVTYHFRNMIWFAKS